MVTCKLQGGLGNTMFQIAATIGYALKWGMAYHIPLRNSNPHYVGQPALPFKNIVYSTLKYNFPIYTEPFFHYQEIPRFKNVVLDGYFQSEKYFQYYRPEIEKAFGFTKLPEYEDAICIHVRRGDYLKQPQNHSTVSKEYIEQAISIFIQKGYREFYFISDDIQWCKDNFKGDVYFNFVEGGDEISDMQLGASCAGIIGSASSFSWWISWLQDGEAIFPEKWFGRNLKHNTSDLYLSHWITL
jgi:hypothetical protein